jgi:hypothetical protein
MPNFDAGHYFLTALVPLRDDAVLQNGTARSRLHIVQEVLADMPAAQRTLASKDEHRTSPFSRSLRTHFARFAVLNDTVFNGRPRQNAIAMAAHGVNPMISGPVDQLPVPYLLFAAEFDAADGSDTELQSYLSELWRFMEPYLTSIFENCYGFHPDGKPDYFFRYLKACQIETTQPFNDYWSVRPKLPTFPYWFYLVPGGLALLTFFIAPVFAPWWASLIAALVFALVLYAFLHRLAAMAELPFPAAQPPAAGGHLPEVLKALRLQRAFTQFAIEAQGKTNEELTEAFGAFLATNKPDDLTGPTQNPGVII